MSKIRCNQCRSACDEKDGFCKECGAVFTEPIVYITDEEAKVSVLNPISPKKEKKKWFSSLFASFKSEEGADDPEYKEKLEQIDNDIINKDLTSESVGKRKIRCNECKTSVFETEHEGFCPECGAIFTPPYTYVTYEQEQFEKESQKVEKKPVFPSIVHPKEPDKNFELMSLEEKQKYLLEKLHDIRDKTVNQRYWLNEKANECMQCFTSAGAMKSNDYDEVLASMIKRRYENLEEFEVVFIEYKRMLDELNQSLQELNEIKSKLLELNK